MIPNPIKPLAALLLCALTSPFAQAQWQQTTKVLTSTVSNKSPNVIFLNNYTPGFPAADVWHTVDLRNQGLTAAQVQGARWVSVGGIAIITHGSNPQQCNLTLAARPVGSALSGADYIVQTIEPHVGGGTRSTFFFTTAVVDGKFEWQWRSDLPASTWPSYCAYGLNGSLQMIGLE